MIEPSRTIARNAALLVFLFGSLRSAAADEPRVDRAPVAEALFRDGRRLMEAGSYAEACVKLGESQRIDPRIGTLLNLAACHDLEGRTATAWAEYTQAASESARAGRSKDEAFGRGNAAKLEARLSRLVLTTEHPADGLVVSLDSQTLGPTVLGTSLPVDPGKHRVAVAAPGRVGWSAELDVAPGPSTRTVVIPELALVPSPTSVAPAASTSARRTEPPTETPTAGGVSPLVWAFGGLTLVSAGAGSYLGLRAFSKNREAGPQCPGGLCTESGLSADTDGRHAATASTVAFGVAGVAAALTVYFLVSAGPARVALSPSGVSLRSTW